MDKLKAAIVVLSDSCYEGKRRDQSGHAAAQILRNNGFYIECYLVLPDELDLIVWTLQVLLLEGFDLIVTCGSTGASPRDVAPEATRRLIQREIPGIPELMRLEGGKKTKLAFLSRAACGIVGSALLLNLPGSVSGVTESLGAVVEVLPHVILLSKGATLH